MTVPSLYLSRATVRDDVPSAALAELLATGPATRVLAGHRLIWTLFGDDPDRGRDFLWREDDRGRFYLLSARPPEDSRGLFRLDPPREFAPALRPGDRLRFALRVNATVARRSDPDAPRGKPCDVVMDALYRAETETGDRATTRAALLHGVARDWMAACGVRRGFRLSDPLPDDTNRDQWEAGLTDAFRVLGYRTLRIARPGGRRPMRIGVLDLEGELEVDDPATFLSAVGQGFGRAKAFGCGLMLLRRLR